MKQNIRILALLVAVLVFCTVPAMATVDGEGIFAREAETVHGYTITIIGESSSSEAESSSSEAESSSSEAESSSSEAESSSSEAESSSSEAESSSSEAESSSSEAESSSSEAESSTSEKEVQRVAGEDAASTPKKVETASAYRNDMDRLQELTGLATDDYVQNVVALESMIREGKTKARIAYLTFDDGPYGITPDYLAVLDKYNVKGAFFVLGKPARASLYSNIISRGHTLCNHTYSHRIFDGLYASPQSFINDVVKLENYLKGVTGVQTNIVRFPGGSPTAKGNRPAIIENLKKLGYGYIDWTAMTGDGGARVLTADESYHNVMNDVQKQNISVVLMHDYSKNTLAALPRIITGLREQGFLLLPLIKESSTVKK